MLFGSQFFVSGLTPKQTIGSVATNLVGKDLAYRYFFYQGIAYGHMYDNNDSSNKQTAGHDIGIGIDTSKTQSIACIKY